MSLDCRLNWQRLWAVTPEPPATALCWRPDGMALAVGHQDGTVSILDAENGESLNQGKMVTGGLCLPSTSWLCCPRGLLAPEFKLAWMPQATSSMQAGTPPVPVWHPLLLLTQKAAECSPEALWLCSDAWWCSWQSRSPLCSPQQVASLLITAAVTLPPLLAQAGWTLLGGWRRRPL